MSQRPPYLIIAGNIGAGKSTLARFIHNVFDVDLLEEPNDANPFLADFYQDMPRWAFHAQVNFLAHKAAAHHQIQANPRPIVQDRSIWEDAEVFAASLARRKIMSREEHQTYRLLYEGVTADMRPPDLMIYLKCPVGTLLKRIARRGRAMESEIDDKYLRALERLYRRWIGGWTLSPILEISTRTWDPLHNILDQSELLTKLSPLLPLRQ